MSGQKAKKKKLKWGADEGVTAFRKDQKNGRDEKPSKKYLGRGRKKRAIEGRRLSQSPHGVENHKGATKRSRAHNRESAMEKQKKVWNPPADGKVSKSKRGSGLPSRAGVQRGLL